LLNHRLVTRRRDHFHALMRFARGHAFRRGAINDQQRLAAEHAGEGNRLRVRRAHGHSRDHEQHEIDC
jgi:hypothetical protein